MYSTQHTHSLSTAFHTLLKILIAWVPLSILDSKYSKLEYRFPYSTRVWVRYRANTQRWVEYRVWLSILDSKYSKLEYNFPYSTQNTQSLSTTSHTRLKILIGWVQLSILYSSMSTVSGKYSTMSRVSSMTFHTRLNILKAWVQLSILDSKYSKLEYNFPYSTQNTQSLSTAFNTLLKILYSTQHNREILCDLPSVWPRLVRPTNLICALTLIAMQVCIIRLYCALTLIAMSVGNCFIVRMTGADKRRRARRQHNNNWRD